MHVASTIGKGTSFRVDLPLAPQKELEGFPTRPA